jgi:hypothetical protein
MRYKLLAALVFISCAVQAQQVNPVPDYVFQNRMSVGRTTVTDTLAYFSIGPRYGAIRGFMPPMVVDTALVTGGTKRNGLTIFSIQKNKYVYWDSVGSKWAEMAGTGGSAINSGDTASMLSPYTRGSGTTNYLPKFTGTRTLANSVAYDNGGTELLVNTTSDAGAYALQVNGNGYYIGNIAINTSGQTRSISTYYGANSDGANIFIGGGGGSSVGVISETYRGSNNTSAGVGALQANTTGFNNSAFGKDALLTNTTGYRNTAIGVQALDSNTTGFQNSGIGNQALYNNTTGVNNTAVGMQALYSNKAGDKNTANGFQALYSNTSGLQNTATGVQALYTNTTGSNNTSVGFQSLYLNTDGSNNIAIGLQTLYSNTTGFQNAAGGVQALYTNTSGYRNTGFGRDALYYNSTGYQNTALGASSGYSPTDDVSNKRVTTDYNMTLVGYGASKNSASQLNNSIAVGVETLVSTSNTAMWGNASMSTHIFQSGELLIGSSVDAGAYALQVSGAIYNTTTLTTGAPTSGTAKPWRLGEAATVSPTSPNRTIRVEIDGTVYYLHAKTTND